MEARMVDDTCDVCCGTGKPLSDAPCICGGTGSLQQAFYNLREFVFKLQQICDIQREHINILTQMKKEN